MPCAEQPKRVIARRVQALDDKQGGNTMTLKRKLVAAAIAALGAAAAQAATTELVLYKSDHFRGPAQSIKGEVNNLENGMGHEASSMVVRGGAWQVCTGDHFSGRCKVVREGEYPTLGWLNDRIVSVKF